MVYTHNGILLHLKEKDSSDTYYGLNEAQGGSGCTHVKSLGKSLSQTLGRGWRWGPSLSLEGKDAIGKVLGEIIIKLHVYVVTVTLDGQSPLMIMPDASVRLSKCGVIRFEVKLKDLMEE